jgi:hypothetical protein
MKMFILIAVLHLNNGIDQTDVIDYGLTGEDCIAALQQVDAAPAANTEYFCAVDRTFGPISKD